MRTRTGSRSKNSSPRGCYRTRDGGWIAVSGSTPRMAERFRAYGLDAMLTDPRFATNEARVRHAQDLDRAVSTAVAARTLAENITIINAHTLTAVPVQTMAEIERDPHWASRALLVDVPTQQGSVRMHTVAPAPVRHPGPGPMERW